MTTSKKVPTGSGAPQSRLSALDVGKMRKAMAWKVKYRIQQPSGKSTVNLPWDKVGAHPDNRAHQYPGGRTVQNLAVGILKMGCSQDEAEHMSIVIQEKPQGRRLTDYNQEQVTADPILEACFPKLFQEPNATFLRSELPSPQEKSKPSEVKEDQPPLAKLITHNEATGTCACAPDVFMASQGNKKVAVARTWGSSSTSANYCQ